MSQLTGLNQTQQTQASNTNTELQAAKLNTAKTEASISNSLRGEFKLQGQTNLVQQLTMAQANKLAQQPLLALLNQQTALIFLQSQSSTSTLALPTNLLALTMEWLKSDKSLSGKLPKELASFLSEKLGLNSQQLQNQLLSATLKQSLLQLSFLQGEAVVELKLGITTTQQAREQLEQLLQFILPVPLEDDASLLLQQQESKKEQGVEDTLRFRLQFDLAKLGKLEVQIELKDFELNTICTCDSALLQQKVERHWPLLQERLNKLGFDSQNQIKQKTRLDDKTPKEAPSNMINIKV